MNGCQQGACAVVRRLYPVPAGPGFQYRLVYLALRMLPPWVRIISLRAPPDRRWCSAPSPESRDCTEEQRGKGAGGSTRVHESVALPLSRAFGLWG